MLIWDTDSTGNVYVNEFYLAFFGTTFESVVQDGWERFVHPDDGGYITAIRTPTRSAHPSSTRLG